ncbi:hypothetical protein FHR32_005118 [Streptosporangium album]|uniref:Uncharacterized protein n=1 Tax=Streptosporangium album TaxID=47479 RepID=A0A7W7WB61_9ACTN|nr:hypothetical protein [Streptosporangium album]MBB4940741.1 hypothetical protein [Streptosporangium album]
MSEPEGALPVEVTEALIVRPGDTLILRLASNTTPEQFARSREMVGPGLKERLPGVEVVWLGGIEQMAVYHPDQRIEGD